MSTQHTPGPWTSRVEQDREEVWIGVPGQTIGMKVIATVQYGFTPPANLEQQANARLIAAAPDLLAFAKKIAGECAECGGDGQMFWYPDGVRSLKACTECVDVRAVIAKAEGQS